MSSVLSQRLYCTSVESYSEAKLYCLLTFRLQLLDAGDPALSLILSVQEKHPVLQQGERERQGERRERQGERRRGGGRKGWQENVNLSILEGQKQQCLPLHGVRTISEADLVRQPRRRLAAGATEDTNGQCFMTSQSHTQAHFLSL